MQNKYAVMEGLLFIAGDEGIEPEKLATVLEISLEQTEQMANEMIDRYEKDESRGIILVTYGGRYKIVTKESIGAYAQKLYEDLPSSGFSAAALETLAIIAYKQPVTRAQIEQIRGVSCDMIVRRLQARGLIREAGRSEAPGRPFLYEVTEEFMDSFKLESLKELPKMPEFERAADEKDLFE